MHYLWLHQGDSPWELTSYVLRRDIYHCLPEALDKADWLGISADLVVRNAIAQVENMKK